MLVATARENGQAGIFGEVRISEGKAALVEDGGAVGANDFRVGAILAEPYSFGHYLRKRLEFGLRAVGERVAIDV